MGKKAIGNKGKNVEKKKLEEEVLKDQVETAVDEQEPIDIEATYLDGMREKITELGYILQKPFRTIELGTLLHVLQSMRANVIDENVYEGLIKKFNQHYEPKLDIETDLDAPYIAYNILTIEVQTMQMTIEKNKKK